MSRIRLKKERRRRSIQLYPRKSRAYWVERVQPGLEGKATTCGSIFQEFFKSFYSTKTLSFEIVLNMQAYPELKANIILIILSTPLLLFSQSRPVLLKFNIAFAFNRCRACEKASLDIGLKTAFHDKVIRSHVAPWNEIQVESFTSQNTMACFLLGTNLSAIFKTKNIKPCAPQR
jgi:hypothetical protein